MKEKNKRKLLKEGRYIWDEEYKIIIICDSKDYEEMKKASESKDLRIYDLNKIF